MFFKSDNRDNSVWWYLKCHVTSCRWGACVHKSCESHIYYRWKVGIAVAWLNDAWSATSLNAFFMRQWTDHIALTSPCEKDMYGITHYQLINWILSIIATYKNGKISDILPYFCEKWFQRKNRREKLKNRKRRWQTNRRAWFSDLEDKNEEGETRLEERRVP